MIHPFLRQVPNLLTVLRLMLAVPICVLILKQQFDQVLWLSLFAGLSDGLDGWLARKLNAQTRFGSIVDPLSDKALLIGSYACFAVVGLVSWWLSALIILRDLIIVCGAAAYYRLYGRFGMQPSVWGKASTLVQIILALALIANQVWPVLPAVAIQTGTAVVALLALISGGHYVTVWSKKAAQASKVKN